MISFATIGTSWITDEFTDALATFPEASLSAVYSRSEEKARAFAEKHGAKRFYTDLKALADDKEIDAVYIASPNSFHASQAIMMMTGGKHVICEKPIASNAAEFESMCKAADKNGVLLMEAYKTAPMPGMKAVKDNLYKLGIIRSAFVCFAKYSSRYDAHKAGKNVNTFKAEFSNGALMDLGLYCLYPMLHLFGTPEEIKSLSVIIPDGVDGTGALIMKYRDFIATLCYNKVSDSFLPSQITGEDATMIIDKLNIPEKIEIIYRDKSKPKEIITPDQRQDSMCYEIADFISCIKEQRTESTVNTRAISLTGLKIMDEARRQGGVVYKADKTTL